VEISPFFKRQDVYRGFEAFWKSKENASLRKPFENAAVRFHMNPAPFSRDPHPCETRPTPRPISGRAKNPGNESERGETRPDVLGPAEDCDIADAPLHGVCPQPVAFEHTGLSCPEAFVRDVDIHAERA
jgi:hypothetical protein